MSKWAIRVGGILIAAVAILLVVAGQVDWNKYRADIAAGVSAQSGLDVLIGGDIQLDLLPVPALQAAAVRLADPETGEEIATVGRLSVAVDVPALISGRIRLGAVTMEALALTLEETVTGDWQLRGFRPAASEGSRGATALSIDKLTILRSTLTLAPRRRAALALSLRDISLSGQLPGGPLDWQGDIEIGGAPLALEGRVRPTSDQQAISIFTRLVGADSEVTASGRLGSAQMSGRIVLDSQDLAALSPVIAAFFAGNSSSTPPAGEPLAAALDLQIDGTPSAFKVEGRRVQLGQATGALDLEAALSDGGAALSGKADISILHAADIARAQALLAWLGEQQADLVEAPSAAAAPYTLSGDFQVAARGLEYGDDIAQKLEVALGFNEGGLVLNSASALLPGGSRLALTGKPAPQAPDTLALDFALTSGNTPALLKWVGIDLSERVVPGRLRTLQSEGVVVITDGSIAFEGLEVTLGTTQLSGQVAVTPAGKLLSVDLRGGDINLDSILQTSGAARDVANFDLPPSLFDFVADAGARVRLRADRLRAYGIDIADVDLAAELSQQSAEISRFGWQSRGGRLEGSARLLADDAAGGGWRLSSDIRPSDWQAAELAGTAPGLSGILRAAEMLPLSGNLRVSGDLRDLRLSAEIASPAGNTAEFTADLSRRDAREWLRSAVISGTVIQRDAAVLLRQFGADVPGPAAANLTLSVTLSGQAGSGAPLIESMRTNGRLADGQVRLDLQRTARPAADTLEGDIRYDHPRAGQVAATLLPTLPLADPSQPLSLGGRFRLSGERIEIDDLSLANGAGRLSGSLQIEGRDFSGDLDLSGLTLFAQSSQTGGGGRGDLQVLPAGGWRSYEGAVSISLRDVSVFGQQIRLPAGQMALRAGRLTLTSGDGAAMNDGVLQFSVDVQNLTAGDPIWYTSLSMGRLDMMRLMRGLTIPAPVLGYAEGRLDLRGSGEAWADIKAGLSGEAALQAYGASLNFLDVPALSQSMVTSSSPASFLASMSEYLRAGQTASETLGIKLAIDSGVALIETFAARGIWGQLDLGGQVDLAGERLNISGELSLLRPEGVPVLPVRYEGPMNAPQAQWQSTVFERFALAALERRLRANLFDRMEARAGGDTVPRSPGSVIFSGLFGVMDKLRSAKEKSQNPPDPPNRE